MPRLTLLLLALLLAACADRRDPAGTSDASAERPAAESPDVERLEAPAAEGSGQPRFALAPDGRLLLSWAERDETRAALRFAWWDGTAWSAPVTAAEGDDWFVNWADTPGVVPAGEGRLAAFYLQRTGEGTYDYAIRLVQSADAGRTWSAPATPHPARDAEYGFVSALAAPDGLRLVWLDGRETAADPPPAGAHEHGHTGAMTLRSAVLRPDGSFTDEALLDERVCDCCPTALAQTRAGLVVAYRGRSPDEVRDIALVRHDGRAWSAPAVPVPDAWRVEACPVNGPALAAQGDALVLAWTTGAGGGLVRFARSEDGGATFPLARTLDADAPAGRVDVALAPSGDALVSWIARDEAAPEGAALVLARVTPEGRLAARLRLAAVDAARATGMPRLAVHGGFAYAAWVEGGRVALARVPLAALGAA